MASADLQEFTESQRESFCVYSGHGIGSLRKYLNSLYPPGGGATSDEGSRRGSGSSQSSLTGPADPPHFTTAQPRSSISARGRREAREARDGPTAGAAAAARAAHVYEDTPGIDGINGERHDRQASSSGARISAPVFRYAPRPASPSSAPGLPGSFLTASAPNFLVHPSSVGWAPRRASGPGAPGAAGGAGRGAGGERRASASVSNAQVEVSRATDLGRESTSGSLLARDAAEGGQGSGRGKRLSEATRQSTPRSRDREPSPSDDDEEEHSRSGRMKWVTSAFGRERR